MDVGDWLRSLGLERYEQTFRDNEIDSGLLPKLRADDLKDLGVSLVGHRRRLLDAIAALCEDVEASKPAEPARTAAARARPDAERRQLIGDVRRSGWLDGAIGEARSRGHA